MPDLHDDRLSGDLPAAPVSYVQTQDTEEGPAVSHMVIATYVADAARSVRGIVELRGSAWKSLSSRVRETHSGGVVVKDSEPGAVDVDIHVRVAWGTVIPELARQVERAVRDRVAALLSIDLRGVTLFVDEIAGPPVVGTPKDS